MSRALLSGGSGSLEVLTSDFFSRAPVACCPGARGPGVWRGGASAGECSPGRPPLLSPATPSRGTTCGCRSLVFPRGPGRQRAAPQGGAGLFPEGLEASRGAPGHLVPEEGKQRKEAAPVTGPESALSPGCAERPGALFPGFLRFEPSLAIPGSGAAPALCGIAPGSFPQTRPGDLCASGADPGLRAPGSTQARLLGVAQPRRLAKPAPRAPGALRETTPRQGELRRRSQGLGGARHVFSAAPQKRRILPSPERQQP
uniref:Uncharacterized protein LOC123614390 n=1 Tax=Camelus bactrianus TaxID=9837 RepID=A0A9W3FSS3_CAMBA|nr:uncharacterized protein LOC123614390 [Camelus bactrianus]